MRRSLFYLVGYGYGGQCPGGVGKPDHSFCVFCPGGGLFLQEGVGFYAVGEQEFLVSGKICLTSDVSFHSFARDILEAVYVNRLCAFQRSGDGFGKRVGR